MEYNTENIERNSRSSCLEIRNLSISHREQQDDLIGISQKIFRELSVEIKYSDLNDIRLLTTKTNTKTLLVTLHSVILKNKLLKAYRDYNNQRTNMKLNTSILDTIENRSVHELTRPIYISENLSARARRLFHAARIFAKQERYKYCWTSHGKILLRKEDNTKIVIIESESQLSEMASKN
ncbi:hypothetical protein ACJJTC_012331 [Scirpophaga incertulas]